MSPRRAATPSTLTTAARRARPLLWPLLLFLGAYLLTASACASPSPEEPTAGSTSRSFPALHMDPAPPPTCPAPDASVFPYDLPPVTPAGAGTIEASFAVSQGGEATYTMQLNVPPGRNGMQPSLAVTYHSGDGDSPLGMGFSLSGLSSITRCPRNVLEDGRVGGVTYTAADALCLDGQHLVMVPGLTPDPNDPFDELNCKAPDCYEYRTHPDSFMRVLARYGLGLAAKFGPEYFDVFTKSGLHLTYGSRSDPTATVMALDGANAAWWVTQSSDRDGNTIEYSYWNDLRSIPSPDFPYLKFYTAEIVPWFIRYTGHPTLKATRTISFDYDTKDPQDVRTHYDHGAPLQSSLRLKSIFMSEGQTTLRAYNFRYGLGQNTHRTLLQQVEECSVSSPSVCKPPTVFTWSSPALGFSAPVSTMLPVPESPDASVMTMDMTGDGLPDLAVADLPKREDVEFNPTTTLWNVALNAGPLHPDPDHSPYYSSPFTLAANEAMGPAAVPGAYMAPERGTPIDYNHDGRMDLLLHDIHGQHKNWTVLIASPPNANKPTFTLQPLDTGIPRVFGLGVDTPPKLADPTASAHVADLDGDGIGDLIQCKQVNIGTFEWTVHLWDPAGPGFSALTRFLPPISVIYPCNTALYTVDLDNDSIVELVMQETNQDPMGNALVLDNYVTLSLVAAHPQNPQLDLWTSKDLHLPTPAPGGALFFLDVNGDGLPDAVETGFSNHLPQTFLNTGDPTVVFAPGYTSLAADPIMFSPDALVQLATPIDYNGDGLQDLLLPIRMSGPNNSPSWVVLQSSKQDPTDPASPVVFVSVVTSIPFDTQATVDAQGNPKITLADPHGPRVADLDGDGGHDVLLPIGGFFNVFRNTAADQDLLTSITDGRNDHDPGEPGFTPTVEITYDHLIDLSRTDGVPPGALALDAYRYVSQYDQANTCAYPRVCSVGPQRVVGTYALNVGASEAGTEVQRHFSVQYRDGRYHRWSRKSLGFGSRIVNDLDTGAGIEAFYDNITLGLDFGLPHPYAGQIVKEWRWNPGLPTQPNPQQIELSSTTVTLQQEMSNGGSNHFTMPVVREVRRAQGSLPPNTPVLAYVKANEGPNPPAATVLSDTTHTITSYDNAGNILGETSSTAGVDLFVSVDRTFAADPFTSLVSELTDVHECSLAAGLKPCRSLHRTVDPGIGHVIAETQRSDVPSELQATQLTTTFEYDLYGNVTTLRSVDFDGDSRSACISYDEAGFPFAHINPAGHLVYTKFHPGYGVLLASVDANHLVTQWEHDGLGRVTAELRPDGTSTTYALSRVKSSPPQGNLWRLQQETNTPGVQDDLVWYDSQGRVVQSWQQGVQTGAVVPPRIVQGTVWDPLSGNVAARSVPTDEVSFEQQSVAYDTYAYDATGRVVRHTAPWSAATTYAYAGLTITVTDPKKNKTVTTLDGIGRPLAIQDAAGGSTLYSYGPFGGLHAVTAPDFTTTSVHRDAFGRVTQRFDPDRGTTILRHNGFGLLAQSTDALNRNVWMYYDPLGRAIQRDDGDGTTTWAWDTAPMGTTGKVALGRIAKVTSPQQALKTYTYDALARPRTSQLTVGSVNLAATVDYDTYGRLATIAYPTAQNITPLVVQNNYDDYGHMLSAQDAGSGAAYWTLTATDGAGRITGERFGKHVTTTRGYFPERGRVQSIVTQNDGGTPLQSLSYAYDDNQNLVARGDMLQGGMVETFLYDELDRVWCAYLSGLPGCQEERIYAPNGNIASSSSVGAYTYDAKHPHAVHSAGLGVYTYDDVGNQIGRPNATLLYTAFDKPRQIALAQNLKITELEYDGDQARIRKTTADEVTVYFDDLYERVAHAGSKVVEHKFYIHSSERTVAVVTRKAPGAGTTIYAHTDHLGSVDVLTDEQGKLVEQRSYDAFGARRNPLWGKPPPASFSSLTTMGFTGHESDDELGLINMKGRMYDPKVGRFLTMDPVVSDPYSGQGWNPYSYVANNPLTYVDPSGFSAVPVEASSPPPDCYDQGRLCGSSGKGIHPVEVTVHRPKSMQGPREDATQHGAAATPTDVGTVGTAVGVAPTPDPTATSSVWRHIGSFALGLGKAYAHQVLDYTRSTTLNVFTLGGYGFFKFWWHIGEKAGEAIVESQRLGEHGFDVALSGLSGGLSAVSPLHQVAASITNIKTAAKEGDYERLGEALEPVVVAIVATVVTGKLAGVEAGEAAAAEGASIPRGGVYSLRDSTTGAVMRTGRTGNLARRALEHARDPALRDYQFRVEFLTDVYAEQRALEQVVHEVFGPPLNKASPISPKNPNWGNYESAARDFLSGDGNQ